MEVLYPRCAGLDVHKATVVAAVRLAAEGACKIVGGDHAAAAVALWSSFAGRKPG